MQTAGSSQNWCLEQLCRFQLPNGGWPFHSRSSQAAVEPTALALLALPREFTKERDSAIRFLIEIQNPNGSWPAFSGDGVGSGFTGLAAYALQKCGARGSGVERALHWVVQCRGRESHWFWKWKFRTTDRHVRLNPDKFGWPWMPGTVSWVVPTAYSILALKSNSTFADNDLAGLRIRRGIEMLYDRMCPAGGWNAGNGVVYDAALEPHVDVTALALLALSKEPTNAAIAASLEWLKARAKTCRGPWSLGWTILALDGYGIPIQHWTDVLSSVLRSAEIIDCATLGIVCLAFRCLRVPNVFGTKI